MTIPSQEQPLSSKGQGQNDIVDIDVDVDVDAGDDLNNNRVTYSVDTTTTTTTTTTTDGDEKSGCAADEQKNGRRQAAQAHAQAAQSSTSSSSWLRDDCIAFRDQYLVYENSKAMRMKERLGLLRIGVNKAMSLKKRFPNSQFLEFGVHEGKDMVRMAAFLRSIEDTTIQSQSKSKSTQKNNKNSNSNSKPYTRTTFHGFDSFEGLPEDWINGQIGVDDKPFHKRGAFDTGGQAPDIDNLLKHRGFLKIGSHAPRHTTSSNSSNADDNNTATSPSPPSAAVPVVVGLDNVQFHKGWFHETLPQFLNDHTEPVAFVHADADLYSSTITFLKMICERKLFRKGSVIVFDEFWNYPNWENGEYKAWLEIVDEFELESKYEYFGYHAPPDQHPTKKHKFFGYQSVGVLITCDMN